LVAVEPTADLEKQAPDQRRVRAWRIQWNDREDIGAYTQLGAGGMVVSMTNDITHPRPVRMRAALRHAIKLRITEGKTVLAACEEAGMSPQGYHKAMKRPEVRDHYQEVQIGFVESIESDKPINLARAYETGIDLMKNSKSDAVKARMVEFFLAEKNCPHKSRLTTRYIPRVTSM
jgi:hypothetical protein